jgi:hypothetical protein
VDPQGVLEDPGELAEGGGVGAVGPEHDDDVARLGVPDDVRPVARQSTGV